jgi:hypothetical protein
MKSTQLNRNVARRLVVILAGIAFAGCASVKPQHPTILSPFGDGTQWIVVQDLVFDVVLDTGATATIRVPRGFVTDLASTPRTVWSIYPPFGKYLTASILHDYLYWRRVCKKGDVDKILYQAMHDAHASLSQQTMFFDALTALGDSAWDANAKEVGRKFIRVIPEDYIAVNADVIWDKYRMDLFNRGIRETPVNSDQFLPSVCAALGNEIKPITNPLRAFSIR